MCALSAVPNPAPPVRLPAIRLFGILGTWMEEDIVAACIRNAFVQGCERVYLVDNGSTDRTVAIAVAEGARLARTYVTTHYDEHVRLAHMNDVVAEVSAGEPDEHLWWMFMDADEFIHGPHGLSVAAYLGTLDRMFRVVGTRYFNHYPGPAPHYASGAHPLDFQPMAEEIPWMMCPSGHRKHPLLRHDRQGPVLRSGRGFHIPECDGPLLEPAQPAFLHHFPFREESVTRRRLASLWDAATPGGSRAIDSDDAAGHMLDRFRGIDAVYAGQWDAVDNFFTGVPGVAPRPWTDLVEPEHHHVQRTGGRALTVRVSIIIIFLNGLPFLHEALASVLEQTFHDWELLLVDDGSSDGSTELALAAAASDPARIRYLRHDGHVNRGMSASRNRGLQEARGEYVAFLDADDVWLPEKLACQVRILDDRADVDMVYGDALMWFGWTGDPDDIARDCYRGTGIPPGTRVEPPGMLTRCFPLGAAPSPTTSGYLVRRTALEAVGGSEESFRGLFEDQALLAKLYLSANILVTGDRLDKYRVHPQSCVTQAVNARTLESATGAYLEWLRDYLDRHDMHDPTVRTLLRKTARAHRFPLWDGLRLHALRFAERISARILPAAIRVVRTIGLRSTGDFIATPNPVVTRDRFGAVVTVLRWDVRHATAVEIRVGSPSGTLLAAGGPRGEIRTGKWVTDGTRFYLQDVTDSRPLTLRHTISIATMRVEMGD